MEATSSTSAKGRRGRQGKHVADVMHQGVITCHFEMPVPEVARLMTRHDISSVPVVDDDGSLAGIITRTDMVALRAFDEYWREARAENVMVRKVVTVAPDETMAEATRLLTDKRISRVIVCSPEGECQKPVGVLALADIVRDMSLED